MLKSTKSIKNLHLQAKSDLSNNNINNINTINQSISQKSPTTVSKSSSEGISSLDCEDSVMTSIEDNSNNNQNILVQKIPEDEQNFKVSVLPNNDSLVLITEDLSNTTSENTSIYQLDGENTQTGNNLTHSYRQLAEPMKNHTVNTQDAISDIDPLTVVKTKSEVESIVPIANSKTLQHVPNEKNDVPIKNNTFPRMSKEEEEELSEFKRQHKTSSLPNKLSDSNTITPANKEKNINRRTFQSINTIKIPDNYQRTELAATSGHDHHHNHRSSLSLIRHRHDIENDVEVGHNLINDLEHPKRMRVSKTSSFLNSSRIKSRMKADELYNIPGENISESHENYAIVYDLVTGIRFSVSRCSKIPSKITDDQFTQETKLIFNRQGNNEAPPTKYEFKFKDYAPEVFRDLRSMFNVNQADYLMSLNDEIGVKAVGSSGKSGSSFYYSNDRKFIIKTIHRSEHKHLRRILKDYYYYVKKNPNTLLCQFYGLHRLKMTTKTGTVKVHVLVMNNLLPNSVNISDCYDLKGSTFGRKTSETKRSKGSCLKDLNFIESNCKIHLSKMKKDQLENQLQSDVKLLQRLNIMDYSLLLGLRYLSKTDDILDENIKRLSMITHQNVPGAHKNTIFDTDGGIRAIDSNGEEMDIVYYIGIIDCLTNYSTLKKLETFFRSLKHKRETISAVPPYEYGNRFLKFIKESIETPGEVEVSVMKNSRFKAFKKFVGVSSTA